MEMRKIGVVVLNYNNFEDTLICIESILVQMSVDVKLVVVDNGSTNNSFEIIKKAFGEKENVIVLKNKTNLGYAKGNNVGIKYLIQAEYKYIFVANSDIKFESADILYKLVNDDENRVGILVPIIKNNDGSIERRVAYRKKWFTLRMIRSFIRSQLELLGMIIPEQQSNKDIRIKENYKEKIGLQKECYIVSGSGFMLTERFTHIYNQLFPGTFLYGEEWATMIYLHKARLLSKVVDTGIILHRGAASTPSNLKEYKPKMILKAQSARKIFKLNFMNSKLIRKKYNFKN